MKPRWSDSALYWERGRLARNLPWVQSRFISFLIARPKRIAGETPALPVTSSAQRRSSFSIIAGETPAHPVSISAQRRFGFTSGQKLYPLILLALLLAILGVNFLSKAGVSRVTEPPSYARLSHLDNELSVAATAALGNRDGTVVVMDPRSGRVIAVANPQNAFGEAYAPGSTIKPFSTLAALRSGLIKQDSKLLCREHYAHDDFATACSHPISLPPLNLTEAIAYSCNYYFGKLGEQLRPSDFNSTLSEFGFGRTTGIDWGADGSEAEGRLPNKTWQPQNALGESDQVLVTPIQLLTAYSALLNGGHRFEPRISPEEHYVRSEQARLYINAQHRQSIVEGLRGSIRYGTAERAGLHSLPVYVLGKTGTSTQIGGFRTQGWFVGFASAPGNEANQDYSAAENLRLAVLVFLKRGHGIDAAELARPIFESFVKAGVKAETGGWGDGETAGRGETGGRGDVGEVRVHLVTENVTQTLSLEEYVAGVVATEGSTENEPQALKALAVAARTFAVRNLSRHESEGYDFCTTTHCQRYQLKQIGALDNGVSSEFIRAVKETAGEALQSEEGQIVDSYFSASCGGATADISTLWGVKSQSHLTGATDNYCLTMPHSSWTDEILITDLHRALRSDERTDVGERLTNVVVVQLDKSGRAQSIRLDGQRPRTVSGWDFKIIVGRALGWHLLKSSRFEIRRKGASYVFRGRGFGHGLGLCQEGAHVMARRGVSYKKILAHYFPRTRVSATNFSLSLLPPVGAGASGDSASIFHSFNAGARSDKLKFVGHLPNRHSLTGEHFRVSYPETVKQQEVEYVLRVLESGRSDLIRRVSAAGLSFHFPSLELYINKTTGDFVGRTGQPPWVAAATRGTRIEMQPFEILKRRGILESTLRHEMAHVAIDLVGRGRTPRWLNEGLAIHVAGEGRAISHHGVKTEISLPELEKKLSYAASAAEMRAGYAAAYAEVQRLIRAEGEAAIWQRVKL